MVFWKDFQQDFNDDIVIENSSYKLMNKNKDSNGISVTLTQNKEAVDLTGYSVVGYVMCRSGATYEEGRSGYAGITGNKAWFIVPYDVYADPGLAVVSLTISKDGKRSVVLAVRMVVEKVVSNDVHVPSSIPATIEDLEEMLAAVEEVKDACEDAAAFLPNTIAPAYSASATYAVGDYVTKDGYLYQCNTAISTAEAWTSGHWTAVKVGEQVSDLKSALTLIEEEMKMSAAQWERGALNMSDSEAPAASSYNSDYRARTPVDKPFICGKGTTIAPASGFYIGLEGYNDSTGYFTTGWITSGSYTVTADCKMWVVVRAATESGSQVPLDDLIAGVVINYNSAIDQLQAEIDNLETGLDSANDDIDNIQGILNEITSTSLVNNADSVGSGAAANTRRWLLPNVIPANSHIGNVQYHTSSSVSGTVVFEVWKKNGDTLTLDKSVTSSPAASSVNTVNINYTSTTDVMIGWRLDGGTSLRHQANTTFTQWASRDLSSSTLSISEDINKTEFTTFKPCVTIPYTTPKNYAAVPTNIVFVGPGMDYEQIQDAIEDISDDSAENPYTILVMPKGTPYERFSTLRSFDDTYPWNSVAPRYISIIGIDRKHCVIRSDSGNYKLPCGEPMLNGAIKNLTFIMTNEDQDPNATQGGYCLHIDCRTLDDVGYNMLIEDCDFEDASGPCLGIGMHKNCTLTIRRCNFKTTLSQSYAPHEGYTNLYNYGVIFCHTSSVATATDQRINIEDCFGTCEAGGRSLWIWTSGDYSPSTASFYYRLLRNVFWNFNENAASYLINSTLTADPMNFGNNNA